MFTHHPASDIIDLRKFPGLNALRRKISFNHSFVDRMHQINYLDDITILNVCIMILSELTPLSNADTRTAQLAIHNLRATLHYELSMYTLYTHNHSLFKYSLNTSAWQRYHTFLALAINEIAYITVTPATEKLWNELHTWLEGKYNKLAIPARNNGLVISKDKNGNYPFLSLYDRINYLRTGVRQLDSVMPIHVIARIIDAKLKNYRNGIPDAIVALNADADEDPFNGHSTKYLAKKLLAPSPSAPPFEPKPCAPNIDEDETSNESIAELSSESTSVEYFQCSILAGRMTEPAICLLDGRSYESNLLARWFEKNNRTPTTIVVPEDQRHQVMQINTTLQQLIEAHVKGEDVSPFMNCPLTNEPMNDAVFCVLDGLSYDEAAIRDYLQTHKMTPGKIPLPKNCSPDMILIANRNLREAIEAHLGARKTFNM